MELQDRDRSKEIYFHPQNDHKNAYFNYRGMPTCKNLLISFEQ